MENIKTDNEIYFYDDRGKHDYMLKMTSVLFEDDEMCLCIAQPTDPALILKVKLLFNLKDGVVENQHYDSWLATNNVEWAKKHDAYLQSRNLDD